MSVRLLPLALAALIGLGSAALAEEEPRNRVRVQPLALSAVPMPIPQGEDAAPKPQPGAEPAAADTDGPVLLIEPDYGAERAERRRQHQPAPAAESEPAPAIGQAVPIPVDELAPDRRLPVSSPDKIVKVPVGKTVPLELGEDAADIILGDPAVADVMIGTQRRVYIAGREVGATNIYFLDEAGNVVRQAELLVELDVAGVEAALARLLPDERIEVTAVNGSLFLSGPVSSEGAAQQAVAIAQQFVPRGNANLVLNMMSLSGEQQVMLRVRVAEVNREVTKNLSSTLAAGPFDIGDYALDVPFAGGPSLDALGSAVLTGPGPFNLALTALEEENLVKVLAEPNLTTVSGEEASLLAGGEIPVPVGVDDGTIIYEWRPFGVSLAFVPVVVGPGRISLKLTTEVSSIDEQGEQIGAIVVPTFSVRRASSVVELPSGGSIMIAGLLRNNFNETLAGVPGLKDLPVLGALFRSSSFVREETELVFTVTAYIVRSVDSRALALPTDGFVPSSDLDRYLLGRLTATYSDITIDDVLNGSPVKGPIGYIVE